MKVLQAYSETQARLSAYIRANNMRPSAVRNMVLEQACMLHQPFTADQLIKACAPERISVGTVYNSLDLFVKAHILRGAQRQRGHIKTEYEIIREGAKQMQYICSQCGRTVDFHDKAVARLIEERKYSNFRLSQYSLIVYGVCKICRRLGKKND